MKRLVLLAALSFAAVGAAPAGATNECNGLPVCVSVAGPWVLVLSEAESGGVTASSAGGAP